MFSKACEYALRATLYIAQNSSNDKRLGVEEIATGIDAPKSFTAKILQQLNKGHVISSAKGPNGGFFISEKLKSQPVWHVLAAMGEEERINNCVMGLNECSDKKPCPMHAQYKGIKQQLAELFQNSTVADIAQAMTRKTFIRNV